MWDSPTEHFDRVKLSLSKKQLLDKVLVLSGAPSKGLALVLDDSNYEDSSNHIWRSNQAYHFNIKLGEVEEMSSEHLLKLMKSNDYSNLIWISEKICNGTDILFTWVLAHELRHLHQDSACHDLSLAGYFLTETLSYIETDRPWMWIMIPTELDAELSAWRITRELFGIDVADNYVKSQLNNSAQEKSIKLLLKFDPNKTYDPIKNTIIFLRKYQSKLNIQQKSNLDNNFIRNFNIDEVCAELNKNCGKNDRKNIV
ncbi:MAG: hypothetical protein CVV03_07240 [Firmicutes bacterium HGW-Firmicutes-8]|nr:MAG: hypothetical protein CVV03_07240 [Firmicutes bacterium HGW-Firmicutes-8]